MAPSTVWKDILLAVRRAWWELVPDRQYRKPLTWSNVPNAFAYLGPFLFMAYLVRRRNTRLIRLLLMPTVVVMAIRCTFSYDWFSPELCFFSWIRGIAGLTAAAISIDFGFLKEGRYKVGQITLPAVYEPSSSNNQGSTQGPAKGHPKFVTPWIIDAFEVSTALRGIGWDFGKGVYIPPHPRSADNRAAFLKYMAIEHLQTFLLVDLFDLLQKLTPGVGSTDGGSIYFTNLPLIPRYALSTLLTAGTGALMMSGFRNLYATLTLIGVGLLGQSPSAWPPLLDNPWNADSLHDFWGRRWHQALRRTFLVLGGIPGGWIAGRVGTVLGAFIASGLLHEGGMYLMGRGVDHRATAFFVIQGVLVALEYIFKRVTGRRVGGNWGRVWAYVNMLSWAHLLVDAWYVRGLGGASVVPAGMSPSRLILLPVLRVFLPDLTA